LALPAANVNPIPMTTPYPTPWESGAEICDMAN
jgi:hypothetical protein